MEIKYSVIVPVYNSQRTLNRCIESLIREKRDDTEIIMVDDGSIDDSGTICDEYAAKYAQCRVIHKKNGGVSMARNTGLDHAQGQYILFVDSDDYVVEHFFSIIDETLGQNISDYYIFSYQQVNNQTSRVIQRKPFEAIEGPALYGKLREIIINKTINAPWAKVYRRDLIEQYHIRFPEEIYIGEDTVFNTKYSTHIRSLKMSDVVLYSVDIQNENSLSRSKHTDLQEQFIKLDEAIQKSYMTCIEEWKRQYYKDASDYNRYRDVFSDCKRMHLDRVPLFKRYQDISNKCNALTGRDVWCPDSHSCRLLMFVVKHKLIIIIDVVGKYLASKN